jgi:hypothetical protein
MTTDKYFAAIATLDLDPIKVKLMHAESGEGWTRAYADEMEFEYRRFLYLMKKYPHEQAAPLFDVDIFWHYHILDTMKYAEDCQAMFGYFLHHFPYVGLRGEDDLELHHQVGDRMRDLYEETFAEPYIRASHAARPASGKAAFSMNAGSTAFSMNATKVAFSMQAGTAAFSMNSAPVAFSMATGKAASPMPIDKAASSYDTHAMNASFDPLAAAAFNAARPTLSRAV